MSELDPNVTKYLRFGIVIVLAAAAILAVIFAPQVQGVIQSSSAVQLPIEVAAAIQIGIIALLTAGFTWLFNTFGWDFRGLASVIGLALSTVIVAELQNLINLVPATFDPIVNTFLYFLVIILAPAGALWLVKKNREPNHPSTFI